VQTAGYGESILLADEGDRANFLLEISFARDTQFCEPDWRSGGMRPLPGNAVARDQAVTKNCVDMFLRIFLGGLLAVSMVQAQSPSPTLDNQDQVALIALENEWLANLHNPTVLETILASDFVHPLPSGDFVTKAQHIQFTSTHLPPPNRKRRFDQMQVRVYGDVGIVNGIVLTSDEQGREVDRTIFTDVFVRRNGRWEAVNAQENAVSRQ